MELHEKLQILRKQRDLTQEELAQKLYVSRTAVSKWESGRGIPSIESLKALSAFFGVTLDDLLSGNALYAEGTTKPAHLHDIIWGTLDCSMTLLVFLPFFGQRADGAAQAVSLLALTGIAPYLKALYAVAIAGMVLCGILTFALQSCTHTLWLRHKGRLSLLLHGLCVFLFIISRQPYAAAFALMTLSAKALILLRFANNSQANKP